MLADIANYGIAVLWNWWAAAFVIAATLFRSGAMIRRAGHPEKAVWIGKFIRHPKTRVGLIVLLIAIFVGMNFNAFRETKQEARKEREDARGKIAKIESEAAERLVELRKDAEERLSATLLVLPDRVYHIDGRGALQGYVLVKNHGPAKLQILEWSFGIAVLNAVSGDKAEKYSDLGPMTPESGAPVFGPGQSLPRFRERQALTPKEVRDLRANAKRVYVYGLISYHDGYEKEHQTGFCHMYSGGERLIYDEHGNEAYAASQVDSCPNPELNFSR